jgi:hypothetical protein
MLEDATIQTFKEVAGSFFRPEDFHKSDNRVIMLNGTEIMFRSCSDPDALRGPNLSAFWLDEAAMMKELVWDLMIGRLRLEPGLGFCTTTPRGKNWLYKLFVKSEDENYDMVQCSSKSNIYLPDYFIAALEAKYSGHWLKQELEGAFVEFVDAACYEDFKSPVNVADKDLATEDLYNPRIPLKLACDFNNHIMAWQVIQVVKDQPMIIAEISQLKKANIPAMVRKFRTLFPTHAAGLHIYGDASGAHGDAHIGMTIYEIMEQEFGGYLSDPEFYIPKKNPNVKDRVHCVNAILRGVNKWKPLLVVSTAEYFIEDCQRVQWDDHGTKIMQITDKDDDRSLLTHASDGFGYWGMMDMPASFEILTVADVVAERKEEIKQAGRNFRHGQGFAGL